MKKFTVILKDTSIQYATFEVEAGSFEAAVKRAGEIKDGDQIKWVECSQSDQITIDEVKENE